MKCPFCQKIGIDRPLGAIRGQLNLDENNDPTTHVIVFCCYGVDDNGKEIKYWNDKVKHHLFEATLKAGEWSELLKNGDIFPSNANIIEII